MTRHTTYAFLPAVRVHGETVPFTRSRRPVLHVVVFVIAAHALFGTMLLRGQDLGSASIRVEPAVTTSHQVGSAARRTPYFSENTLTFMFGPSYRTPFVTTPSAPLGADISRNTIEFKHLDSWKYGGNLFDVSIRKSGTVEPAAEGGTGALELYAVIRSGISLNRITGKQAIAFGPLRDISFEVGANLESKNSDYAPEERTLYIGPNFQFRFLSGFLNVGLHYRKEWNHNGVLGTSESYNPDFNLEPTWRFPFRIHTAQLAFEGFADLNTPKGKDSFGGQTHTEILIRPQLKIDLGSVVGHHPRVLDAGIGLEYWHNVYGKPAGVVPGAKQLTPIFSLTVHLPGGHSTEH
jgi:nucleoside-specific outer membrane channel protein Tsx